jgi:hypothetical protein
MLIWCRCHLERVLDEYVRYYNDERPHRGLALRPPRGIEVRAGPDAVTVAARVRRRDRLGGLVHEYYQIADDVRVSEPNGRRRGEQGEELHGAAQGQVGRVSAARRIVSAAALRDMRRSPSCPSNLQLTGRITVSAPYGVDGSHESVHSPKRSC